MFLSNTSIRRPVFASVLMLMLVTLGIFSYRKLAIDLMPDVEIPVISVLAVYPGASPEAVEREVSRKIEEAVNPIAGVRHVTSISREGLSTIIVEFELEVKLNDVAQEARAKIAAIRNDLPQSMEEPVIQKLDIHGFPVVSLAIRSATMPTRELTTLVDRKVKRRLENISGVGKVTIVGGSTREVSVNIDPARLESIGMGVNELIGGLAGENVNTPLGRVNRGTSEMPLRVSGRPVKVSGFSSMVISQRNGSPVRLGDVAEVVDGVEEQRSAALVNGVPAVALEVYKQSKVNTVKVADDVKAEIEVLRKELPGDVKINLVQDTSVFIRESLADVQTTIVIGGFLTILIVFCFLNSWRSTVITGLTLPISVISSFIAMYFLGMTINAMTLMALSLAIGLLIDDAIVVRENIVRHLEKGQDHVTAAQAGTSEIGLAVMATSFSIIAVFIPVAFMKGIVGRFFFQFGLTVAFAVLVSLFVSFTLDPMLSSRWYDPDIERAGKRHFVARLLDVFNAWFYRMADRYRAAIRWALDHRKWTVAMASVAFIAGAVVFVKLESEFFPVYDHEEMAVRFKTAPDASFEETYGRMAKVIQILQRYPEIEHTYGTIGAGDSDTVRDARVYVKLKPKSERKRTQAELMPDIREHLMKVPGLILSVEEDPNNFQKPLQVLVRGPEIPKLKAYSKELKKAAYNIRGIKDIEVTLELDLPEYRMIVNREKAQSLGLSTPQIVGTIGALVGGQVVSTYEDEEGEALDIRVRLPLDLRNDITRVGDLKLAVSGPRGATDLVPISDLVAFQRAGTPVEIDRMDLSRQVVLSANLDGLPLGTASDKIMQAAGKIPMEPGYKVQMAGDTEIMVEAFGYMAEALLLAIVFVYLILAAQFESFIDPFAIMLSLPLSVVGMAGMLLLTGDTVNIMSLIGLILLMGLVTKNAILLVDYTKVLRSQGMERKEAIILAGRTRLRPIMMTTLAMIFGMLPLALGLGQGAEMRAPMARAVIGGLITSTMLTLLVVPVVYSLLDDFASWLHKKWTRTGKEPVARATRSTLVLLLAALLLIPVRGAAQAPAPIQPQILTLEQALLIADEHNRDIQKAIEYQKWIEGKYQEERSRALPQFNFYSTWRRDYDDTYASLTGGLFPATQDTGLLETTVKQPVFTWGKIGAAIKAARFGFSLGDELLRQARQNTRRDVTEAFYNVLLAQELQRIASENEQQKHRQYDQTQQRYTLGTATDYDVLAAEVDWKIAGPPMIRSQNLVLVNQRRLLFLLGLEYREIDIRGSLDVTTVEVPRYELIVANALKDRPELRAQHEAVNIRGELLKIAKAGNKPYVDFNSSYGKKYLSGGGFDLNGTVWGAGITLNFPFFDGFKTTGQTAEALSDLDSAKLDEAKLRDSITIECRIALDQVNEALDILNTSTDTVAQAEKLLAMAEKGYELGVKIRLEVDDAQLNLTRARGSLATARHDYLVALTNLQWVQGHLGQ